MEEVLIQGHRFLLHPEKAIYWPEEGALLLADLHLGKGAHFRRAGIAVPRGVMDVNFQRLRTLIEVFQPRRVIFLGDLFHSEYNHVWPVFRDFTHAYPALSFELVPGNHDILPLKAYEEARMLLQPEVLVVNGMALSHHPLPEAERPAGTYNLYGHLHPAARLLDAAGNTIKLPAFHFGRSGGILPAFGEFTGCVVVRARRGDRVFVIAGGGVIAVS